MNGLLALLLASCLMSTQPGHGQSPGSGQPQVVSAVWITGEPDIELSIDGKKCGLLPQRLVISFQEKEWRLGFGSSSALAFEPDRVGKDLSHEEQQVMVKETRSWVKRGYKYRSSYWKTFKDLVVPLTLKRGTRSTKGYVKALPFSPAERKFRLYEMSVPSDIFEQVVSESPKVFYLSGVEEAVIDVILGTTDPLRSKVRVALSAPGLLLWNEDSEVQSQPLSFVMDDTPVRVFFLSTDRRVEKTTEMIVVSVNPLRFGEQEVEKEIPAGAGAAVLVALFRPEDKGFFASTKIEFEVSSDQVREASGGKDIRFWVKNEKGQRVGVLWLTKVEFK